jgi:hypothetical protein
VGIRFYSRTKSKSSIRYEVTTKLLGDYTIVTEVSSVVDDVITKLTRSVLNTQEVQVREALIKQGWTPPLDKKGD